MAGDELDQLFLFQMSSFSSRARRRNLRFDKRSHCDSEGYPAISYKDKLYRVFKHKLNNGRRQDSGDNSSINLSEGAEDFFDAIKDAKTPSKKPWYYVSVFVLCLVILIILFVLTSTDCPTVFEKSPNEICDDMITQLEKLQVDLDDAKEKLNYQLPDPNFWTNFALESHGAKVHTKRSSKTYERNWGIKIFGFRIFSKVGPVTVIQGQYPPTPGNCWAFPGSHGNLVIELSHTVIISHVTLDHVLSSVSPADTTSSAPHRFSVYGLRSLSDTAVHLGKFTYDLDGNPSQTFAVKVYNTITFKYVDLQIETNYGHADYTCLYGFRVHGKI